MAIAFVHQYLRDARAAEAVIGAAPPRGVVAELADGAGSVAS